MKISVLRPAIRSPRELLSASCLVSFDIVPPAFSDGSRFCSRDRLRYPGRGIRRAARRRARHRTDSRVAWGRARARTFQATGMTSPAGPSPRVELSLIGDGGAPTVLCACPLPAADRRCSGRGRGFFHPSMSDASSLPGRERRIAEPPFTALEPLVASAVDAIAPLAGRPFALFGHSMGALVAFETARTRRAGRMPRCQSTSSFRVSGRRICPIGGRHITISPAQNS